jgi:LmbE family N-acetylglucosaminyl deacetylase
MFTSILLPHMDDEVFIFPYLAKLGEQSSSEVRIYFLTRSEGRGNKFDQSVRENESKKAISKILPCAEVHFLGRKFDTKDQELHAKLSDLFDYLHSELNGQCDNLISPHFEGGHIDHDSSSILASELARALNCKLQTFHLYSARGHSGHFFRVGKPTENDVIQVRLMVKGSVYSHTLMIPIRYKSQFMTWLGIYPSLVWRTLIRRKFLLNIQTSFNPNIKPNFGRVLYENRGDGTFSEWSSSMASFRESTRY